MSEFLHDTKLHVQIMWTVWIVWMLFYLIRSKDDVQRKCAVCKAWAVGAFAVGTLILIFLGLGYLKGTMTDEVSEVYEWIIAGCYAGAALFAFLRHRALRRLSTHS